MLATTNGSGGRSGMYQLLIVDDEKVIRDGLSAWNWEEHGIQVAGRCGHGLEALQFITNRPVDIVMTDIRMPFMDGIALMESLERMYPFIKIIVLSGYSDFGYAKKATQYGAIDYVLKPVAFGELANVAKRLTRLLDERQQDKHRIDVLARKAVQLTKVLREDFLLRLFAKPLSAEELEQGAAEGEMSLEAKKYTAAVLRLDRIAVHRQHLTDKERSLLAFSLDNILSDLWDAKGLGYHLVNREEPEVYLLAKDGAGLRFEEVVSQLHRYVGLFRSTFSLGIGEAVFELPALFLSMKAAKSAIDGGNMEGEVRFGVISIDDSKSEKGITTYEQCAVGTADVGDGLGDSIILVEAMRFMKEHFGRSLTLKEVADHVFVSTGHLSMLFKNAGERFLKCLTTIRMNKAKELMMDNSYKIYEIVELVGYSDPAYFAEIFKKHTGKTPNEYRGKWKQSRNG